MARFSLVLVAVGVLLVAMAAEAWKSKTTITTTTIEGNPFGSFSEPGCFQQMAKQKYLNKCGEYLKETIVGGSSWFPSSSQSQEELKQICCQQLSNIGDKCMCPGIQMLLNQPMLSGMGHMMGQLYNEAAKLPMECNLMSEECELE
ncbi:albumin-8-like [Bidens hawaiensis]|uniref:albumin-8-like n=1 Tax=Bidens hawaiensis TaxID=980011 RepID=UPI00404B49E4